MFSNGVNPYNDQPVQFLKGRNSIQLKGIYRNCTVHVLGNVCILFCDHTFYAQSHDYGGKSSRIFGRISLPSSGDVYYNYV